MSDQHVAAVHETEPNKTEPNVLGTMAALAHAAQTGDTMPDLCTKDIDELDIVLDVLSRLSERARRYIDDADALRNEASLSLHDIGIDFPGPFQVGIAADNSAESGELAVDSEITEHDENQHAADVVAGLLFGGSGEASFDGEEKPSTEAEAKRSARDAGNLAIHTALQEGLGEKVKSTISSESLVDGRSVNRDAVRQIVSDAVNSFPRGTELSRSEVISAASLLKPYLESYAVDGWVMAALKELLERGEAGHNGKIKSQSRYVTLNGPEEPQTASGSDNNSFLDQ